MPQYNSLVFNEYLTPRTRIEYIVIHHSAGGFATVPLIHAWHLERGFKGGGYHFVVSNGHMTYRDHVLGQKSCAPGQIWLMRPSEMTGAHARGFNAKSVGICVVGDYDDEYPLLPTWNSAVRLAYNLAVSYDISVDRIIGHRETYPLLGKPIEKSCPGNNWDLEMYRGHVSWLFNSDGLPTPWEQSWGSLREGSTFPTVLDQVKLDIQQEQEKIKEEAKQQEAIQMTTQAAKWEESWFDQLLRGIKEMVQSWMRRRKERTNQ